MKRILFCIITALLLASCGKYEYPLLKERFVYFAGASSYNIQADAKVLSTYNLRLCSPALKEDLKVELDIKVGDALKEGRDFEFKTESSLKFLPGVYTMPFRIQWLPNASLDRSKDCTVTISIASCSDPSISLGMSGPAANGKEIKCSKL